MPKFLDVVSAKTKLVRAIKEIKKAVGDHPADLIECSIAKHVSRTHYGWTITINLYKD